MRGRGRGSSLFRNTLYSIPFNCVSCRHIIYVLIVLSPSPVCYLPSPFITPDPRCLSLWTSIYSTVFLSTFAKFSALFQPYIRFSARESFYLPVIFPLCSFLITHNSCKFSDLSLFLRPEFFQSFLPKPQNIYFLFVYFSLFSVLILMSFLDFLV